MDNQPSVYPHDSVLKTVVQTIERYAMFRGREKVLVAVSGGPDSVALLFILKTLAPIFKLHLAVAHLNHGLRPQSADREAGYVAQLADQLKMDCHRGKADIQPAPGSLEERARIKRYEFLNRIANKHGYTKIALGHQANDNAEAVLMHLLRGSGIRGLAGIPPVRDRYIVRPLFDLQRNEILAYLDQRKIHYVQDESNQDLSFERNRIRQRLIPLLEKQYNPNIVATLHRTADLCREDESWLQNQLKPLVTKAVGQQTVSHLTLNAIELADLPLAVQRRMIRDALRGWMGHLRRITADHIDALVRLLPSQGIGKRLNLPYRIEVERTAEHLGFKKNTDRKKARKEEKNPFCHTIQSPDDLPAAIEIRQSAAQLTFTRENPEDRTRFPGGCTDTAWFDLDRISFPLTVRSVMPGDRLTPLWHDRIAET